MTKDGARGALVPERVGEKLHIKALVASPQKQGNGRLLVETFAANLPKDTAIYVQADDTAVGFYEKCGFKPTFDLTAKEFCTPMMMTTGAEPPKLPDGHWIVDHCIHEEWFRHKGWSFGPRASKAGGKDKLHGEGVKWRVKHFNSVNNAEFIRLEGEFEYGRATGVVKVTLVNGNTVVLEYSDGKPKEFNPALQLYHGQMAWHKDGCYELEAHVNGTYQCKGYSDEAGLSGYIYRPCGVGGRNGQHLRRAQGSVRIVPPNQPALG